ncbi:DISARM system phospholipase D-like protein DrmC [Deinococcus peraridilitoris]|uniref:DISARM system phospholipase D-like protein DrmC n=1 Tax=Deinococcus peraridilitoris TaxID=432329 RepID=UPI00059C9595|nr:DISARM system phospholipase D-like protein DrmC [Deinococcus peraridilitoris]
MWQAVARLAAALPPERVEQLARYVEGSDLPRELDHVLPGAASEVVSSLGAGWMAEPVPGAQLASALRGAVSTASELRRASEVALAWTGPTSPFLSVRHTERVLLELIDGAHERVFLVSYVAYVVDSVVKALNQACGRGVNVSILLETSAERGGRLSVDSIALLRSRVPLATLYEWNPAAKTGAVHAKCVVVDGHACLVTSANITDAALDRNMELGVSIVGGRVPEQLDRHLRALVDTRVLVPA